MGVMTAKVSPLIPSLHASLEYIIPNILPSFLSLQDSSILYFKDRPPDTSPFYRSHTLFLKTCTLSTWPKSLESITLHPLYHSKNHYLPNQISHSPPSLPSSFELVMPDPLSLMTYPTTMFWLHRVGWTLSFHHFFIITFYFSLFN